jgi:hypothetical protein
LRKKQDDIVGSSCLNEAFFDHTSLIHISSGKNHGKFAFFIFSDASLWIVEVANISDSCSISIRDMVSGDWCEFLLIELK